MQTKKPKPALRTRLQISAAAVATTHADNKLPGCGEAAPQKLCHCKRPQGNTRYAVALHPGTNKVKSWVKQNLKNHKAQTTYKGSRRAHLFPAPASTQTHSRHAHAPHLHLHRLALLRPHLPGRSAGPTLHAYRLPTPPVCHNYVMHHHRCGGPSCACNADEMPGARQQPSGQLHLDCFVGRPGAQHPLPQG